MRQQKNPHPRCWKQGGKIWATGTPVVEDNDSAERPLQNDEASWEKIHVYPKQISVGGAFVTKERYDNRQVVASMLMPDTHPFEPVAEMKLVCDLGTGLFYHLRRDT